MTLRYKLVINKYLLGFLFFLFIFPLDFFAYLLSVHSGINIPLGFLGIIISAFSIPYYYFIEKNKWKMVISILFSSFIISFFFLMLFSGSANGLDYFYLIKIYGAFLCGNLFVSYFSSTDIETQKIRFVIIWVLMVALVFLFGVGNNNDANYLRLSDSFAYFSIILLITFNSMRVQAVIFVLTVICIYLLGSRASLFLFIASSLVVLFTMHKAYKFILYLIPLIIYIIKYIYDLNSRVTNYNDNRLLRLIFSTDTDTSLNVRKYLNEYGMEVFKNNIVIGDFGYYRVLLGEGMYAHNYIAYLAEFGVFGLLFLLFLIIISSIFIFNFLKNKNRGKITYIVLAFVIYIIIGLLFAKGFYWNLPYFCLGMIVSYLCHPKPIVKGA